MEQPSDKHGNLSDKFEDFEFSPREGVWDRIRKDVREDAAPGFLGAAFNEVTHPPRQAVWRKIAAEINPAYRRRRAIIWRSAAAILLLATGAAIWFSAAGGLGEPTPESNFAAVATPGDSSLNGNQEGFTAQEYPSPEAIKEVQEAVESPKHKEASAIDPVPVPPGPKRLVKNEVPQRVSPEQLVQNQNASPIPAIISPRQAAPLSARNLSLVAHADLPQRESTTLPAPEPQAPVMIEIPFFEDDERGQEAENSRYSALLASNYTSSTPNFVTELAYSTDDQISFNSGFPDYSREDALGGLPANENYAAPIAFGGKFRWSFHRRLGLDAGLNYTLLRSTAAQVVADQRADLNIRRTYLGPSAELVWDLIPDRRVGIFASGGLRYDFALGLNVQSTVTQEGNVVAETKFSESLRGQALGLLGMGMDIELVDRLSLYGQANVNYFLYQGSQNLWSGRQLWPGAQVGLRFDFP